MIKESNGKSMVVNIDFLENENSKSSIYEEGVPLGALVGSDSKAVSDIIPLIKETVESVYDIVFDIDADNTFKIRFKFKLIRLSSHLKREMTPCLLIYRLMIKFHLNEIWCILTNQLVLKERKICLKF